MAEAVRLFSAHLWKGRRIDHRETSGAVLERLEADNCFRLRLQKGQFEHELYKPTAQEKAEKSIKGRFTLDLVSGQYFSGEITKIVPDYDDKNFLDLPYIDLYLRATPST